MTNVKMSKYYVLMIKPNQGLIIGLVFGKLFEVKQHTEIEIAQGSTFRAKWCNIDCPKHRG
jgi:hypothetical protein